jgi:hypothetical protein
MSIIKVNAMSEADALSIRRSSASMSRQSFCLALLSREILTPADATMAAEGRWPNVLLPMLEGMPEAQEAKARIIWASSAEIHRTHWLLLKVAAPENLNIPDDALDAIFGIE